MAGKRTGNKRRATLRSSKPESARGAKPQDGTLAWEHGRPKQFSIPAEIVDHLLLGSSDDRRVTEDSPLQGDVWASYALDPGQICDLLIVPQVDAAVVMSGISRGQALRALERARETNPIPAPRVRYRSSTASLQRLVSAKLYFDEAIRILVPMTRWWSQQRGEERIVDTERLRLLLTRPIGLVYGDRYSPLESYFALAGLIYWVGKLDRPDYGPRSMDRLPPLHVHEAFGLYQPFVDEIIYGMMSFMANVMATTNDHKEEQADTDIEGSILEISSNRMVSVALEHSTRAVKGDAVQSTFNVSCKNIVWAVLDSGIDAVHPAFMTKNNKSKTAERRAGTREADTEYLSRISKTFDFTRIREIVSNDEDDISSAELEELANAAGIATTDASYYLREIANDARARRPINWGVVEKLIRLKNPPQPSSSHGTHVAGIIGAAKHGEYAGGMCPDIRLYDFRVLGRTLEDTEFAVIAALQYIRYVNERHRTTTIHGANLSLSIPHNVRNSACGQTPVCKESERLVDSGVVVVAAAGNRGYLRLGNFEGYASFSITDPGNSDSVITVGATHGNLPQTYGVSFFSSRGPTGDGRHKPDLLAPGEKVLSTLPGGDWGMQSGTSVAAPHVSGAAAMLLARYEDLIGKPRKVKSILCESATDLGRDRNFQGHGMLDVLRAFQSI